jgi:hypothetical protein
MGEKELVNAPICVLAIDPGMSGAVFKIGKGHFEGRRDFTCRRDIALAIKHLSEGVDAAVIENVHAMPGQGVCSMFSFGRSAGAADSALYLCLPDTPLDEVAPQKWQNHFRRQLDLRAGQLFDSVAIASSIVPSYAPQFLTRKKDHNSADAILMAVWKIQIAGAPLESFSGISSGRGKRASGKLVASS